MDEKNKVEYKKIHDDYKNLVQKYFNLVGINQLECVLFSTNFCNNCVVIIPIEEKSTWRNFYYWFLLYFLFIIDEVAFSTIDPRIIFLFATSYVNSPHKRTTNHFWTHSSSTVQVDFMLGSYMDDIGITSKQFEDACGKGSKRSFQHGLFEQVRLSCSLSVLLPDLNDWLSV